METTKTCRVSWEFADGSCGYRDYATMAEADHVAMNLHPDARVWIGSEMVQQGFIAADDVSWMY